MLRRLFMILVAVLLGFIYDLTIWGKPTDIAFPFFIFISLVLGCFTLLVINIELVPARKSVWLFFPPFFFASTASLTAQYPHSLKYNLSMGFTFLYLGLLCMTYLGGQLENYCLFDYLRSFARFTIGVISQPVQFVREILRDGQGSLSADPVSRKYAWAVAILSFLALFGLLWLADAAFREFHTTLFGPHSGGDLVNPFRVLLWSYLILGHMLYAARRSSDPQLIAQDPRAFIRWLEYDRSALVFVAALVPLTVFTLLRFSMFLSPASSAQAGGLLQWLETRFGFWELTLASALVFLLVLWLDHVTIFEGRWDRPVHTALNASLFLNVAVLLWFAICGVKIGAFGIPDLRHVWYARGGVIWLAIMFAMFIIYEYYEQECDFPYTALRVTTFLVGGFCAVDIIATTLL